MKTIDISLIISQAWELLKRHGFTILAYIIGMMLVYYFTSAILSFIFSITDLIIPDRELTQELTRNLTNEMNKSNPNLSGIYIDYFIESLHRYPLMILQILMSLIPILLINVGLYQNLLNCGRGIGELSFDSFKQPFSVYMNIFLLEIIIPIVFIIGLCCCILPGFYLYARLQFAIYYILDHKEASIGEAISESWNMTSNCAFSLCGLLILYPVILIIGFILCCVGIFPAEILLYFIPVVAYLTISNKEE